MEWTKFKLRNSLFFPFSLLILAFKGKPAVSDFTLLWRDEKRNVSLVRCVPQTGRTHQLRVHLSHLGHGIVDDPLYGVDAKNADLEVVDSLGNTRHEGPCFDFCLIVLF